MTPAANRYADPYVAGAALGLVLLASFVIAGRGLGASGAFTSTAAVSVNAIAPTLAKGNVVFAPHVATGGPRREWLVFELLGVALGGFASAAAAGRLRWTVEKGARMSSRGRLAAAALGGVAMGGGAILARGCTSGQALTGGALLSVGGWLFMLAIFASAYLFSPLARRAWRP